ncbi:hypothetical protein M878_44700 [Streptomyces roseochromogenus subsp. oscitans DS 12.976]|uniref:Uncharacterized protein n=1 Tax=Streptomyces roseochromogenus subsp. oscitans DS 12.976 TaxID=1352936 RepID=V6JF15_STRRC|nr:hypothetical protein M878_44700 [Streptomyces roseochromogenus subsp. oscitans DS 12.976]
MSELKRLDSSTSVPFSAETAVHWRPLIETSMRSRLTSLWLVAV